MQKRVKMLTSKWHRSKNTSSYIPLDHFNAFGLSRNNFFLSQTTKKGGGLDYVPFWAPGQFDLTKLAHCTSRSFILQNKITIRPLRHILKKFFWTKSPLLGPRGSGLDQNCTCTTRSWGQQNVTINRSLWYLVTEEIEEQDIVYGQTDRRTAGRRT